MGGSPRATRARSWPTALFIQGRIRGVERPALGSIVPIKNGFAYFLDVGANVDSKPEYMVQFAAMGAVYAREMMGRSDPRVGLLSNGEEEGKGDELVKETARRLNGSMRGFIGNVEPKDLYAGKADVVVADGFVGNIAIKMAEATADFLFPKPARGDSTHAPGQGGRCAHP